MNAPATTESIGAAISARAKAADTHDGDLAPDIALLRQNGWLTACLAYEDGGRGWGTEPDATQRAFDALRCLGRANLSVARLFEGHMNAVKLVTLYASDDVRAEMAHDVSDGVLMGVWGADDAESPLQVVLKGTQKVLGGAKSFASGLGLVEKAIVTVQTDAPPQMLLAPTNDPARTDGSSWRMGGMRATRSGRYDFENVPLADCAMLGEAGDLLREPWFEGGIWRYCAAHLGAAEALHTGMCDALISRDRADEPNQQRRIAESAIAIETMRLWLQRAANAVESPNAGADTATLSLLAREVTENGCRTVMTLVEQSLGMAAHIEGSDIERIGRDLGLFLCQAAPDAKRARAAETLVRRQCLPEKL
ncbi:MAG: acyl-CoA dehydrogenase [Erythrobacter sp.]